MEAKYAAYEDELLRHVRTIEYYNKTGKQLSEENNRMAHASFDAGQLDLYDFTTSLENAMQLTLEYYEAITEYNRIALEIKYMN